MCGFKDFLFLKWGGLKRVDPSEFKDYLFLKWGALNSYNLKSEAALKALEELHALGDATEQKEALCKLIDAIDGEIDLDWYGKAVSKEKAKQYVRDY